MTRGSHPEGDREVAPRGRLLARPLPPDQGTAAGVPPAVPGLHALGLAGSDTRDGTFYVPQGYDPSRPAPLVLMLHGAGGTGQSGLAPLASLAGAHGVLVLAPDARLQTWAVMMGTFGPDVAFIEGALRHIFARYAVDPTRLAIAGFSDGASYALSLGLTNGDLFSHVIAFSPGYMAPAQRRGKPQVYVSHGTRDEVLPVSVCGRRVVHELRRWHYEVEYHEFDGPHTVPPDIAREAVAWLLA